MPKYAVITPTYATSCDSGWNVPEDTQIPEYGCDYLEIEAPNKQQAEVLAVRSWRAEGRKNWRAAKWITDSDSDKCCPFTGLKVEELTEE